MSGDTMSDFITALTGTSGITSGNLWTEVGYCATFIASMAIFAFGYNVIRKAVKGASKGKVRL